MTREQADRKMESNHKPCGDSTQGERHQKCAASLHADKEDRTNTVWDPFASGIGRVKSLTVRGDVSG